LADVITWGGKLHTKAQAKVDPSDAEEDSGSVISSADGEASPSFTVKQNVIDMATALLQLAQCVETKYLKKPLGIEILQMINASLS